ncbi:hypothetical protein AS859_07490, partial [Aliarcobacter cryaerophilus]
HFKKIDEIMEYISYNTILASSNLAIEKGSYPTFDGSNWSKGIMPHDHTPQAVNAIVNKDLFDNSCDWDFLREKVKKDGMRNGYLMAIASTSSFADVQKGQKAFIKLGRYSSICSLIVN